MSSTNGSSNVASAGTVQQPRKQHDILLSLDAATIAIGASQDTTHTVNGTTKLQEVTQFAQRLTQYINMFQPDGLPPAASANTNNDEMTSSQNPLPSPQNTSSGRHKRKSPPAASTTTPPRRRRGAPKSDEEEEPTRRERRRCVAKQEKKLFKFKKEKEDSDAAEEEAYEPAEDDEKSSESENEGKDEPVARRNGNDDDDDEAEPTSHLPNYLTLQLLASGYDGSLEASALRRSQVGLTRAVMNEHLDYLGLSAKFGVPVVSSKVNKVSQLTFNAKWNSLPYGEHEPFQWFASQGSGKRGLAVRLDPSKHAQSPIPIFWAVEEKGGALCYYVGHFRCVKYEAMAKPFVFKKKERCMLFEFQFMRFDERLAEKLENIASL